VQRVNSGIWFVMCNIETLARRSKIVSGEVFFIFFRNSLHSLKCNKKVKRKNCVCKIKIDRFTSLIKKSKK